MDCFLEIETQTFPESSDNDIGAHPLLDRNVSVGVLNTLISRGVGSGFTYLPACGIDELLLFSCESTVVYRTAQ